MRYAQWMQSRIDPVQLDEPIGRLSRMDAIQMQQMALAGLSREQQLGDVHLARRG